VGIFGCESPKDLEIAKEPSHEVFGGRVFLILYVSAMGCARGTDERLSHFNQGRELHGKGDLDGAIAEYPKLPRQGGTAKG